MRLHQEQIVVKAPASVANLGSGFDALGVSLSLYNTVILEPADSVEVFTTDGTEPVRGSDNLIWDTVRRVCEFCGETIVGLRITETSPIPQARGLGSSSACIAAGVVGANHLLGDPLSRDQIIDFAVGLEGHPDNIMPALLGGFVSSVIQDGHVWYLRKEIDPMLRFCAFIPDFELLTSRARAALPKTIPHGDAVFNLSRSALMAAAFCEGRTDLFRVAAADRLHQPYRMPMIPGAEKIFQIADRCGALCVFVSGAGPTVMAICDGANESFAKEASALLQKDSQTARFRLTELHAHNGAMI